MMGNITFRQFDLQLFADGGDGAAGGTGTGTGDLLESDRAVLERVYVIITEIYNQENRKKPGMMLCCI